VIEGGGGRSDLIIDGGGGDLNIGGGT